MGTSAFERAWESAKAPDEFEKAWGATPEPPKPAPKSGPSLRDFITPAPQWGPFLESAADFPTAGAFGFVGDMARAAIPGQPTFTELRDARRARRESLPVALQLASAVPGMYANPGTVLGPAKAGAGLLARAGRGLMEGGIQGGAQALGLNLGTSGPILAPALMGMGIGAGFGAIVSPIAAKLAGRGGMADAEQNAARMFSNAAAVEGVRAVPSGPNLPMPIAADAVGEVGQGIIKAAGRLPEARTALRPAMEARASQQLPSLLRTLDDVTATTTDDAVALAQKIRTAEQARDAANGAQKAQYAEQVRVLKDQYRVAKEKAADAHAASVQAARDAHRAAKPVERTPSEALDAMKAEGDLPDIDATLKEMHKARGQVGAEYEDIWKATRGQEVPSTKESEAFLKTRVGQAVWNKVQAERADIAKFDDTMKLPTKPGSAEFEPVPDAEAWHRMKQYVNKAAKVGAGQGPIEGVTAADAIFARDKMLPALREQSKAAAGVDLQYANMSDEMRAFAVGANRGKWSKSFDEMKPAEQESYRAGRRAYFGQIVRGGKGRDVIAKQLSDPSTVLAQEADLAFGAGASQRIARQIATPTQAPFVAPRRVRPEPLLLPKEPAAIPQSPEAAGFMAGESIFDAPAVGSGSRASVSEVRKSLLDLPVDGQKAGQKGLAGRYRNSLLEGRPLGLDNPAQRERFGMAATSPAKARQMVDTELAWDKAMKMQDKILSGDVVVPADRIPDIFGDIAGGVSMNPGWWLTLSARRRAGEMLAAKAAKRQGETAREVIRIAKSEPDAIGKAINTLKQLDEKKAKWSSRASARAGRVGGLLGARY